MESTRQQALKIAQRLGCYGAHESPDGSWLPCSDEESFIAVSRGEKMTEKKGEKISLIERKTARNASMSKSLHPTREQALAESKRNGCTGVRVVMVNGGRMYAACMPKNNGRPENTGLITPANSQFEKLGKRGVGSIETLPDGGLVSGKEDISPISAKGFVNYVSRSTDPDVYTNPDSARVRSRQLGCIGIRSYTASDGKTVYLPCTNSPDYNRTMNLRPDGRPKKQKKSDDCGCEEKSAAKTPAPKKDKIIGSKKNRIGSAGSISSAADISMDKEIVQSLIKKSREHNLAMRDDKKPDWSKTNLRALKAVYRRGAGAFSSSHRPGVGRNQWAMGRVNAFLRLLSSGSAKSSYTTDNDLLPKGHPWKSKGIGEKSLFIDGDEHFAELIYSAESNRYSTNRKMARYSIITVIDEGQ
jgi:hypothetical protein